jgi:hypothetical protein
MTKPSHKNPHDRCEEGDMDLNNRYMIRELAMMEGKEGEEGQHKHIYI